MDFEFDQGSCILFHWKLKQINEQIVMRNEK